MVWVVLAAAAARPPPSSTLASTGSDFDVSREPKPKMFAENDEKLRKARADAAAGAPLGPDDSDNPSCEDYQGPACKRCGASFNCCGEGGSWANTCPMKNSWEDGFCACKTQRDAYWEAEKSKMNSDGSYRMTRWANTESLNHLFKQGAPSNDLKQTGLIIHCFDDTERYDEPWLPCATGFCHNSAKWWSASIINQKLRASFGDAGLVLSPKKNTLLCSYDQDSGTLFSGCGNGNGDGGQFGPNSTKEMLESHLRRGGEGYNEVMIDSRQYVEQMPKSVAGVVFGLKTGSGGKTFDKIRAVHIYVSMLDRFKLNESQFPLFRANYDPADFNGEKPIHGPAFVDESAKAREFLRKHPFKPALEKWQRHHPYLKNHPELTHEWMRKQNELEQEMRDRQKELISRKVQPKAKHEHERR